MSCWIDCPTIIVLCPRWDRSRASALSRDMPSSIFLDDSPVNTVRGSVIHHDVHQLLPELAHSCYAARAPAEARGASCRALHVYRDESGLDGHGNHNPSVFPFRGGKVGTQIVCPRCHREQWQAWLRHAAVGMARQEQSNPKLTRPVVPPGALPALPARQPKA